MLIRRRSLTILCCRKIATDRSDGSMQERIEDACLKRERRKIILLSCAFSFFPLFFSLFFSAQLSVRMDRSRGSWGGGYIVWVGGLLSGSLQ